MTGLGVVTLTVGTNGEITEKTARVIPRADTLEIEPDPAVRAIAEKMKAELLEQFGVVVAQSDVFISSDRGNDTTPGVRNSEQPLGNLVADAMRIIGGADVAVQNGGGLRADITVGDITKLDINAILPFGNVLVIKEATPAELKAIMEQGLRDGTAAVGWFPQISGMKVAFDPAQQTGSRVITISVNGVELDLSDNTTKFRLATNNFLAAGGDGYTAIEALPTIAELVSLDDMLIEYITANLGGRISSASAAIDGRLVVSEKPVVGPLVAGEVSPTNITASINGAFIPSFNINGNTFIIAEDLVNYGFAVVWCDATASLSVAAYNANRPVTPAAVRAGVTHYYTTNIKTFVSGTEVTGYNIGGYTLIQFDELRIYGYITWNPAEVVISFSTSR
jgi:5'-nucleotidase